MATGERAFGHGTTTLKFSSQGAPSVSYHRLPPMSEGFLFNFVFRYCPSYLFILIAILHIPVALKIDLNVFNCPLPSPSEWKGGI